VNPWRSVQGLRHFNSTIDGQASIAVGLRAIVRALAHLDSLVRTDAQIGDAASCYRDMQMNGPTCVCICEKKSVWNEKRSHLPPARNPVGNRPYVGKGFLLGTPSTAGRLMPRLACETEQRGRNQESAAILTEGVAPERNAPLFQPPVSARAQPSSLYYRRAPVAVRVVLR